MGWLGLGVFLLADSLTAQTWTQNLSGPQQEAAPEWISPLSPEQNGTSLAALSYEFLPSTGSSGLLVTLVFDELEGGFLRAYWKSGEGAVTLSENLYEGIVLPNQRHLLISQELLKKGGILTFQTAGAQHHIHQIRWDWLQPLPLLAVRETEARLMGPGMTLLSDDQVNGEAPAVPDDVWDKRLVTAQITEKAERIEAGMEFSVEFDEIPSLARLECKINGLDLKEGLVLWVNGIKAGPVYPETPDLRDMGYGLESDDKLVYRGWRKASIYLAPGLLQAGKNTLQFSRGEVQETEVKRLALKELKLQLSFPEVKPQGSPGSSSEEELVQEGVPDPESLSLP